MNSSSNRMSSNLALALGTVCVVFVLTAGAQVQTTTTTREGQASKAVRVDRGEVLAVEGNDLVVKMQDGSIRNFEDVPEGATATVDGRQLSIHDLKPGMKLQRSITTTTTPQVVTTIETVTGKVWHVNPPLSVILTLENGKNQSFKIPKDQKFKVNGEMVDAFALKKGMVVTATKIVEAPATIVSQQKSVIGTMPAPPPAPPADAPLLIAEGEPTAGPVAAVEAPATGSEIAEGPAGALKPNPPASHYLPFIGMGVVAVILLLVLTRVVRKTSRI